MILQVFRAEQRDTDALFILTERHIFFMLAWDAVQSRLVTLASGDAIEPIARPIDTTPIAVFDPRKRCVAIHSYCSLLRIVALDPATGNVRNQFSVRCEDLAILDMRFEERVADEPPMLTILHHDHNTTMRRYGPYSCA